MPGERELADEAAATSKNSRELIERLLALGLCSFYKWDRLLREEEKNGGVVDPAHHVNLTDGFTARELVDYRQQASRALDEYIRDLQPKSWWYGLSQSVVGAFIYSIILVSFALIFKLMGSDLGTVFRLIFSAPA